MVDGIIKYLCGNALLHLSSNDFCFTFEIGSIFQFHPGNNVGLGKDHTIFSLIDGLVKFEKYGPDKKKVGFEHEIYCSFVFCHFYTPLVIGHLIPTG